MYPPFHRFIARIDDSPNYTYFKITPLSGFTDTDSQTGTSVTFTLDPRP
jgi:hypothetical protein